MTISSGAATVFGWLVNLTTVGGFIGWWVINCTYLFFCGFPFVPLRNGQNLHGCVDYGYQKQGFDRKELVYYSPLQPYLSWWGIFWATFFLIISGLRTWFRWSTSTFLTFCEYSFLRARLSC